MTKAIVVLQSLFCFNMFAQSYLHSAVQIIKEYNGEEPLASFLKKYFNTHKKFGSRDRKNITHLCYCYFRLGKVLVSLEIGERVLAALYLCNQVSNPILALVKPQWNDSVSMAKKEKLTIIQQDLPFDVADIFPFQVDLSPEIDYLPFASSFLEQPDTYLRIRPGKVSLVQNKLKKAEIPYSIISNYCLAVSPSTKLEAHLQINNDVVVQDVNSQKVLVPLVEYIKDTNKSIKAWDCCAASGGKSILLKDTFPNSLITVSDIRESIIFNLRKRFKEAGISNFHWFVADVANPQFTHNKLYDLVICDAPCSGSGTWGRTPEQLYFFTEDKINHYASLQKKIVLNASQYLKKGGLFLYITCSVFKEENEGVVEFIQQKSSLQIVSKHYFAGYQQKADTLFAALFVKQA
ncbi:methyltransferase domain-containing protein [Chitinophagaceae bacterium LB-8]|uniref:Methyltransferase domain-containing protein n=1 Tax=Paraflavisolibacter caeni TaxID=2982496 RepID=A0A9X3B8V2_9BACT|nr:methyltransferase domain-containing protein [Paraflavisolibacter caeni]MCU7550236.1 methyltransferase domain-containing protein [Paraflavisolibacter caeni]